MSSARRTAGIGALIILVLLIAELATWGNPQVSDPIEKITDYFVASRGMALISVFISMLLAIVYLVFGAAARSTIQSAEKPSALLGDVCFGAAILMAACQLSLAMGTGSLALIGADATDGELQMLVALVSMMDLFRVLALGVVVGAVSIAALRGRIVGRWIGWVGVAASALLLVSQVAVLDPTGPIGNMGNAAMVGLLVLVVWLVAFGVSLLRSASSGEARWTVARPVTG